jgi:hypothetical protein
MAWGSWGAEEGSAQVKSLFIKSSRYLLKAPQGLSPFPTVTLSFTVYLLAFLRDLAGREWRTPI